MSRSQAGHRCCGFFAGQKILIRRSWRPPELSQLVGGRECGVDGAAALQRAHTQLSGVQSPVWWPSTTGIRAAGRSAGPVRTPPPSTAPTMPSTRREGIEVCAICLEGLTLPDTSRKNRNALDPANSSDYRLASAYCENRCMLRQNLSAATRAPLAELHPHPSSTGRHPQSGGCGDRVLA